MSPLKVSAKFLGGGVVCWIMESLCLPTEVFHDLSVTFTLLVKVKVTVKETGVGRETGCDNFVILLHVKSCYIYFMSGELRG